MLASSMNEMAAKIFCRWGHEASVPVESAEQLGVLIAISVGLGSLFNENRDAERHWMQTPHAAFKTRPITMIRAGNFSEVLRQVNKERHL